MDRCGKLRQGRTYRHGDPLVDEYEGKTAKDLHSDLLSIEEHLLQKVAALYDHVDELDWITSRDMSWYQEYMGQVTAPTGLHHDYYFYSFSDLTGAYNMNVEVAAKCDDGQASCVLVPREYLPTLEDRTE